MDGAVGPFSEYAPTAAVSSRIPATSTGPSPRPEGFGHFGNHQTASNLPGTALSVGFVQTLLRAGASDKDQLGRIQL